MVLRVFRQFFATFTFNQIYLKLTL
ncbi:unnamed protein product [Linum tenue]|uniref:Uncharacterized protein n=1 Tax=Linum tenue TaxID=586396 RepID=A0AAV0LAB0_9ROSI|nr:unnamed protein product [Linum tenue]CAI0430817.1 unnamed protein product [Linum tenue]